MIRQWIIRLGFIAAVLGFFASLAVHLATFAGLGWAQLYSLLVVGGSVYIIMLLLAWALAATTRPMQMFKAKTPWWVRMRRTFALRPLWANLLYLLSVLLCCYALALFIAGFNQPAYELASLRTNSAVWLGMNLLVILSLGEVGLGWWNRWVAERGGIAL